MSLSEVFLVHKPFRSTYLGLKLCPRKGNQNNTEIYAMYRSTLCIRGRVVRDDRGLQELPPRVVGYTPLSLRGSL